MNALIFVVFLILCWFQAIPDNQPYVNQPLKTPFKSHFNGFSLPKGTAFKENIPRFGFAKKPVSGALGFWSSIFKKNDEQLFSQFQIMKKQIFPLLSFFSQNTSQYYCQG